LLPLFLPSFLSSYVHTYMPKYLHTYIPTWQNLEQKRRIRFMVNQPFSALWSFLVVPPILDTIIIFHQEPRCPSPGFGETHH
jgi:hypothetical protein